ncbi:MAG: hypothetical protein ACQKBV_10295 [Puniceicoccales bacterium]
MPSSPQSFRRYLLAFALMAGGGLLLVGCFNFFIDPYGVFGMNTLGIYASADRESKPMAYARGDFDAVIMGNSKAAMIPAARLRNHRFFSATFGGAMPEELYYFAERNIHDADLAIVMLDFWSFRSDPPVRYDPFAPQSFAQVVEKLLSITAVEDSIKTLRRKVSGEQPAFAPDGSFIAERWIESKSQPNDILRKLEFREHARWFVDYEPSPERMAYLEKLADLFRERGIPVVVVLAPMHEESLALMDGTPAAEIESRWKSKVRALFPQTIDLIDSGYSAPENFFPADPTHFRPEVGVEMINREVLGRNE